jgi:hypothetical protein
MTDPLLVALESVLRVDRRLPKRPAGHVVLKENDTNATLNELNIECGGCGEVLAFTLDFRHRRNPVPLSEHTRKATGVAWNKVCDGVFVWRRGPKVLVFLCELKSQAPTGNDWKRQLWSSACFVQYLFEIVWRFSGISKAADTIEYHAMAFHGGPRTTGSAKRRTGIATGSGYPPTELDNPGRMPVRNRGYVPLNALCR